MCSVAGSKNNTEVSKMLGMMKHRSPDDENIITLDDFNMGMGRLSILDLKSNNLCPRKEDTLVLSFNGEIYNYIELRKEIGECETSSDTEVLLKAYKKWGIKCLDKLNGMFAFAIYDKGKIFLARDIAGEKPLYYTENPFRFASEAKALFEYGKVKELLPAHYLLYENGKIEIKQWWKLKQIEINPNTAEQQLEDLLEDAIKIRTRSDVPYGLYLSGGIDSALINTFHNFKYTFTYNDKDYKKDFLKNAPKIYRHLDYPIKSFSPYGLWKLAEMASKKVKVVLSGEGADELFGGYVRFVKPHFNYKAKKKFPSYQSMFEPAKSVNESGWEEFNGNMRELLRMGDRMSSAWGLENRCPFLDKRIIEFAFSLPDELKIRGLDTKIILKNILKKRNPNYKDIEKVGLYCNVNKWIGSKQKFQKDDYLDFQEKICPKIN